RPPPGAGLRGARPRRAHRAAREGPAQGQQDSQPAQRRGGGRAAGREGARADRGRARRQDPAPGGTAGEALSVPKKVEPAEAELRRRDLASDPLEQFRSWFAEAGAGFDVPEAIALATATPGGAPSVRMVLLKGFDECGLVFFSHHTSRKGCELEANPQAALLFHWSPLGRQVRVEGRVERVSDEESDAPDPPLHSHLPPEGRPMEEE